jgi:hypothetical protein
MVIALALLNHLLRKDITVKVLDSTYYFWCVEIDIIKYN